MPIQKTATVRVSTDELREVIHSIQVLEHAHNNGCPGEDEPYSAGVTCLRCSSLQRLNSMLPEGERERGISEEEV